MITKKGYTKIASIINDTLHEVNTYALTDIQKSMIQISIMETAVKQLCAYFQEENPNFDYNKFINKCLNGI